MRCRPIHDSGLYPRAPRVQSCIREPAEGSAGAVARSDLRALARIRFEDADNGVRASAERKVTLRIIGPLLNNARFRGENVQNDLARGIQGFRLLINRARSELQKQPT